MEENNFIYENGKIFTSDEDNLHADSMIVENGYIKWNSIFNIAQIVYELNMPHI